MFIDWARVGLVAGVLTRTFRAESAVSCARPKLGAKTNVKANNKAATAAFRIRGFIEESLEESHASLKMTKVMPSPGFGKPDYFPCSSRNFSASMAAMQPVP